MHRITRAHCVRNALGAFALVLGGLSAWAQSSVAPQAAPAATAPTAPAALGAPIGEVTFSRGVGFAQQPGLPPRTLGVGLPLTEPSLGSLISNGFRYIHTDRVWLSIYPGIALMVTVVAINLVGDQVRTVLDPRQRR